MRLYNLEGKSILTLKQLRDLVAVNTDLTVEEKKANLEAIDNKLNPTANQEKAKTAMLEGLADTNDVF